MARKTWATVKIVVSGFLWVYAGPAFVGAPERSEAQDRLRQQPLGAVYVTGNTFPGGYNGFFGSYAYRPPVAGVYVWSGRRAMRPPVVFSYSPPHYYGHHYALEALPSVPITYPGYIIAYPNPLPGVPRPHGGTSWVPVYPLDVYRAPASQRPESRDRESPSPMRGETPNLAAPEIVPVPTPLEVPVPTPPANPSPLRPKRGP